MLLLMLCFAFCFVFLLCFFVFCFCCHRCHRINCRGRGRTGQLLCSAFALLFALLLLSSLHSLDSTCHLNTVHHLAAQIEKWWWFSSYFVIFLFFCFLLSAFVVAGVEVISSLALSKIIIVKVKYSSRKRSGLGATWFISSKLKGRNHVGSFFLWVKFFNFLSGELSPCEGFS